MIRYDCRFCEENVFDVTDVRHLDTLPRTWTCSGCGRQYTGEINEEGQLIVYLKGYKRYASVYPETGPEPAAPVIAPEPVPEEITELVPLGGAEITREEPEIIPEVAPEDSPEEPEVPPEEPEVPPEEPPEEEE